MQVSPNTIEKLKMFSVLSDTIILVPGTKQMTITPEENILAEFILEDEFPSSPKEIAINKLGEFVNIIRKFKSPEMVVEQDKLTINDENTKVVYKLYNPELFKNTDVILTPYSTDRYVNGINGRNTYFEFVLPRATLIKYLDLSSMNTLTNTRISVVDKHVYLKGFNKKEREDDTNIVEVMVSEIDSENKQCVIDTDMLLKIAKIDYKVRVEGTDEAKFVQFINEDAGIKYTTTLTGE